LNQISNFQPPKNHSVFLFPFFYFGLPVLLPLSFWPILYSQSYFCRRPSQQFNPTVHSANQSNFLCSSLTSSRSLWPPRPPCRSSLYHSSLAPWSLLPSSPSSPLKTVTPHRLPSPFSSPVTNIIQVPPLLPPSP
jgi:hypothetical protein